MNSTITTLDQLIDFPPPLPFADAGHANGYTWVDVSLSRPWQGSFMGSTNLFAMLELCAEDADDIRVYAERRDEPRTSIESVFRETGP
jgi:hypothetical protein